MDVPQKAGSHTASDATRRHPLARRGLPAGRATGRGLLALALAAGPMLLPFPLLAALPAWAGAEEDGGPLAESRLFGKGHSKGNLAVFWSDNELGLVQKSWDYVPPDALGQNAGLLPQARQELEAPQDIGFFFHSALDLTSADFDGDGFEEFVATWERGNGELRLLVPQDIGRNGPVDVTSEPTLDWTEAFEVDIQDLTVPGTSDPFPAQQDGTDFERLPTLRVVPGDFDGDGLPELLFAYWDADGKIQILLFDFLGGRTPTLVASIADESLPPNTLRDQFQSLPQSETATRSSNFDLAVGDFDDDDVDEFVLVFVSGSGSSWTLRSKTYGLNAGVIEVLTTAAEVYAPFGDATPHLHALAATGADLDGDGDDEVAIGFNVDVGTINADVRGDNYLQVMDVNLGSGFMQRFGDLLQHTVAEDFSHPPAPGNICNPCYDSTEGWPMTVVAADIDDDPGEELFFMAHTFLKLYDGPPGAFDPLSFKGQIELPLHENLFGENSSLRRTIEVADLDPGEGDGMPEVVFLTESVSTGQRGVQLQVYELQDAGGGSFTLGLLTEIVDELTDAFVSMTYALTVGRFNGPDVSLGRPTRSSITDITQPLVVLSAPPLHFDILGGEVADLNLCYPVSFGPAPDRTRCEFVSSYEKSTETTLSLTTEFHSDWSLSAGIEGEVSALGNTLSGSLEATFGMGFSRVESERRTETIAVEQRADIDDWIYAATVTYDVWEYPVFTSESTDPAGYVAVVRPRFLGPGALRLRWFNSKSYLAQSFLPPHEVGNVLSYREIAMPDEASAFAEAVRFATSDTRTLSVSGGGGWSLALQEVEAASTTRSTTFSLEASVSLESKAEFPIEGFDPGGARLQTTVAGTYNEKSISTADTSFSETVGINFDFTSLDPSIGDVGYDVTPYVYWAENGALVLTYAASPELAPPNNPQTWWQEQYGSAPDPTFIQPWRRDPEKGIALTDDARRFQTRDIRIEPADAAHGEDVTIYARVQNYSLLASPPVQVAFYLGDPDVAGATFIGMVSTHTIQPRDNEIVSFDWVLPLGQLADGRIYAVIDPANLVANEIHEDNNKGWNALAIPVPEPALALAQLAGVLGVAVVRRRVGARRRGGRPHPASGWL